MLLVFLITMWFNKYANSTVFPSKHPCLLTPAGVAFSIWGIIYLGVAIFVVRENFRPSNDLPPAVATKVYLWFMISCVFNITWLLVASASYVLVSFFVIVGLWLSVGVIYRLLALNVKPRTATISILPSPHYYSCTTLIDYIILRLPFTLYFGWTTGAMLINLCLVLLHRSEVQLSTSVYCAFILALVGCHVVALLLFGEWPYVAVGVWTLFWLAQQRALDKMNLTDVAPYAAASNVEFMAILSLGVIAILFGLLFFGRYVKARQDRTPSTMREQKPLLDETT